MINPFEFLLSIYSKLVFAFILLGGITLLFITTGDVDLFINTYLWAHSAHIFFSYFTHLGLGFTVVSITIILLFFRYYYSILSAIGSLITLIFVFLGKQIFFKGWPRPTHYIPHIDFPNIVDGFTYHCCNTFPSGHSMSAFAFATIVAIIVRNIWVRIGVFVFAFMVGLSRMYLLQHFFRDVYAGAILGYVSVLLGLMLANTIVRSEDKKLYTGKIGRK